jgi:hypothetical protein
MKNKKLLAALALGLILVVCAVFIVSRPSMYGNDTASMQALIAKELDTEKALEVFDTIDIDDVRVAGYVMEKVQLGYALFKKNASGNYELTLVKNPNKTVPRALDIAVSYLSYTKGDESSNNLVVLSNNPQLSQIGWTNKDNGDVRRIKVNANPSITMIEIPEYNHESEYLFYDKGGQIIE